MPFTFAHPAIVLPLKRFKFLSLTALIIGSVVPDFEYFFRLQVSSFHSHNIWGMFYFDLPIVVLLTFLFHRVVRIPFLRNAPRIIFQRVPSELMNPQFKTTNWWSVSFLCSALIGIFSHLLWDAFTHQHGFAVHFLNYESVTLSWGENQILLFKVFQHISTIIGLFFIVRWILKHPIVHQKRSYSIMPYWLTTCSFWLLFFVLFLNVEPHQKVGGWIILGISSALTALFCSSLFYSIKFRS